MAVICKSHGKWAIKIVGFLLNKKKQSGKDLLFFFYSLPKIDVIPFFLFPPSKRTKRRVSFSLDWFFSVKLSTILFDTTCTVLLLQLVIVYVFAGS